MKFENKYLFQYFKEEAHLLQARTALPLLLIGEKLVKSDHIFILKFESKWTLLWLAGADVCVHWPALNRRPIVAWERWMKFESKYLLQYCKEEVHLFPARTPWPLLLIGEKSVKSDHIFILKVESKWTMLWLAGADVCVHWLALNKRRTVDWER